ncbi:MAG: RNA-directed DNA polymerase [Succinivibrio sp.]|nr:RNA-directed DNA polymerase [Succinivibrio sp.]
MGNFRLVDAYSYQDILNAYFECRHHKRTTAPALIYEQDFEFSLLELLEEINSGRYVIGSSRVFTITFPKPREVWAAQFRDRIVHHLVYAGVGEVLEQRFIPDTYACIKGRGSLAAAERVGHFLRGITDNWHRDAWTLQIDIRNFFVSINRHILWGKLSALIGEDSLTSRLWKQIIFNDPTRNPIIRADADFSVIPRHKSLWHAKPGCGLPIGNLTSQVLANLYLDGLDQFIKHQLKVKRYARYVDDAVLMSRDRAQLIEWRHAIDEFLRDDVQLELHPEKVHIRPARDGLIFVGHAIKPWHTDLRPITWQSALSAARELSKHPFEQKAMASVNSYLGMARHHNTYNRRKDLCELATLPGITDSDPEYTKVFNLVVI